jgi:NADH:ubiquinone oxidoreductase subunit E
MAWKVKDSANAEIPHRDEPWCTEAMKAHWTSDVLPCYVTKHGALMPILNDIQDTYRQVPLQAMVEVAAFLDLPPAEVLDTSSFYEAYTSHKTGRCLIGICQSIACEICGHTALLDHVTDRLGIEPHESTDDGLFTLLAMECLGSCDTAPVALFNDVLHENLDISTIDRLIDDVIKSQPKES